VALGVGVASACLIMAAGLVMALAEGRLRQHGVTPGEVWRLVAGGLPNGVMALGLLVLVATPMLRVLLLAAGFAVARDRRFTAVALGVGAMILLGVLLGRI
jgi:uncharacterized membrane protein